MAKVHLDRLMQRYGWTGGAYRSLMTEVIAAQSQQVSNRIGEVQKAKLDKQARLAERRTGTKLRVPDLSEVLPARSVHIRKAADRGKLLSDRLRSSLTRELRTAVLDWMAEGKPLMQGARGEKRGRMNPELSRQFEDKVRAVFASYAKRDPSIGIPPNCRTIADTEIRASVNEIKHGYVARLAEQNREGFEVMKTWVHHPELSKDPRPGHHALNGKSVPLDGYFRVPTYERIGTVKSGPGAGRSRWRKTGKFVELRHPHDPQAPIEEVASCHCEADYTMRVKDLRRK